MTSIPRGKQRRAVFHALHVPRTAKQVLCDARKAAPKITLQDVRPILRSFENRGLATRLNPQSGNGTLYCRTDCLGACLLLKEDLNLYSQIARATTRQTVLSHVGKHRWDHDPPLTATQIKMELRGQHPMSLNHVIRALEFLKIHALVFRIGSTDKRDMAIYSTTSKGSRFCQ